MASIKLPSYTEQNANMLAQVQSDTAVYVGTGVAGVITLRWGREAPEYVIDGVQTAVALGVVLDTFNATHGAQVILKGGTGVGFGTSIVTVRNGSTSGAVLATASGHGTWQIGIAFVFNGAIGTWR